MREYGKQNEMKRFLEKTFLGRKLTLGLSQPKKKKKNQKKKNKQTNKQTNKQM
jgi:hypothetical protein